MNQDVEQRRHRLRQQREHFDLGLIGERLDLISEWVQKVPDTVDLPRIRNSRRP